MIHPSYTELMQVINQEAESDEASSPISSRYSLVLATSKRARQLIAGDKPLINSKENKPLSVAVEEFYEGKIKILPEEDEAEEIDEEVLEAEESMETEDAEESEEETEAAAPAEEEPEEVPDPEERVEE